MSDISLPLANLFYNLSNIALIVGAVLAVIGTVGTIWMGSIRDQYSDQRVSDNEAKTATAVAESAKANQRAQELHESNAKLEIELEKERIERLRLEKALAPRRISSEEKRVLLVILQKLPQQITKITCIMNDPESHVLALDFAKVFNDANWSETDRCDQSVYSTPQMGVSIRFNADDVRANPDINKPWIPIAIFLLGKKLANEKLFIADPDTPKGTTTFVVGHKIT